MKAAAAKRAPLTNPAPERYAHPFFTNTPIDKRPVTKYGQRMTDWAAQDLGPIPKPTRTPVMTLDEIIGANGLAEVKAAKKIRFHATGDTGKAQGQAAEEVAIRMAKDYDPATPHDNPAFFLHLGDVIYGPHKDASYRDEFYRPYTKYPGKIIAVPGNHDGETFKGSDPTSLAAFLANFCAKTMTVPKVAAEARILRETMTQPGVYFWLNAPFLDVIAMYSNYAEGPGFLEGGPQNKRDMQQVKWLEATLKTIATTRKKEGRKALVIATHHPCFSNGGGHSGSPSLLAEFDAAFKGTGIYADAVLAGHSHSYQRHTRQTAVNGKNVAVPFLTCGVGGRGLQHVDQPNTTPQNGVTFDKSASQYGYLDIVATSTMLKMDFWTVPEDPTTGVKPQLFDTVSVALH